MSNAVQPILVTTDLSAQSEQALPVAAEEAKRRGAPVILLHVIDRLVLPIRVDEMVPPQMIVSMQEQLEKDAWEQLEKLKTRFLGDVSCEIVVLKGGTRSIHEEILDVARQRKASLIVLTSRGHGALYHFFLGSTVARVLQATECPVLAVPPTTPSST